MIRATRPGGFVMLHGYTVEQLKHGIGALPSRRIFYTEAVLRNRFAGTDIQHIESYEAEISKVPRTSDVLH